ncbi:hypothetical protein Ae706Ps2_6317 [Pseudonocardia sp. Ae706_Ps2]|nr:hypothetical protein Ae706Ps2_6317 [Pseudonocardia sp. Ae706_Ps2]
MQRVRRRTAHEHLHGPLGAVDPVVVAMERFSEQSRADTTQNTRHDRRIEHISPCPRTDDFQTADRLHVVSFQTTRQYACGEGV